MPRPIRIRDDAILIFDRAVPVPYPRAYQVLFMALVVTMFVEPVMGDNAYFLLYMECVVGFVLISAALASSTSGQQLRSSLLIAIAGSGLGIGSFFLEGSIHLFSRAYGLVFLTWVTWRVIVDLLLVTRKVDAHSIYGALCGYVLLGMVFSFAFSTIYAIAPETLGGIDPTERSTFTKYAYFAFGSLTTYGPGDVEPVTPLAQTMTYLCSVLGQIYLTVVVARLVALYSAEALANKQKD